MDFTVIHHKFIQKTDRKSLYTQIKTLVQKAQEVAADELQVRRSRLQKILEYEDQIYEEEFAKKVKSRIDEDIKKRKDTLLKIKEENTRDEQLFLERKRIQQYMNSCYEIREALREKETQVVKECQMEQILDNERAEKRRRDLDQYWADIQRANIEHEDRRQANEICLRRDLNTQMRCVLDLQMEDKVRQAQHEREEKMAEAEKIDQLINEMRLEEFDRRLQGVEPKMQKYREELLAMIAEKNAKKRAEEEERTEMHRQMIQELQRLEAAETEAARARKRAFYKATMEYIDYVKRMRKLMQDKERMLNDRIDDLYHVDICTKSNIQRELRRKREEAERCYAELRRQVCQQYERQLREETERRECKILENRFAKPEITRAEVLAQRQRNREGLDKQVAELKRIRAEEDAKLKEDFGRASNDPDYCTELAALYIRDGVDYLEPHANWLMLVCPQKEYIPKRPVEAAVAATGGGDGDKKSTCIIPCGCTTRRTGCCHLPIPKERL